MADLAGVPSEPQFVSTLDSAVGTLQEPPDARAPNRRGVFYLDGEWLLDIKKRGFPSKIRDELKEFLNFFYERGLIESDLEATDTKIAPNVAIQFNFTKEPILGSSLAKLHERVDEGTPKLIIYCGDGKPDAFQADFQLMENTESPCFQNTFVVHKIGDNFELLPFLIDIIKKVRDAEYNKYPDGYSCISDVLSTLENIASIKVVNKLRKQLRIEGYPIEDCYLEKSKKFQEKVAEFAASPKNSQSNSKHKFILGDPTEESRFYQNKLDGKILIISIEKFESNEEEKREREVRMSARIDVKNLVFLFHQVFGYPVPEVKRNLKADQIEQAVKDFSNHENHGTFGILVILTHGNSTQLYGTDWKPVWTRNLIDTFGDSPSLAKKPKFFIIDACRNYESGSNNETSLRMECIDAKNGSVRTPVAPFYQASDTAKAEDNSPDRAGLLVAFSAPLGSLSHRLSISGSKFICSLCWVFCTWAATEDVVSMIADVNHEMTHICCNGDRSTKQISSWSVQMTKKFFLTRSDISGEPEGAS